MGLLLVPSVCYHGEKSYTPVKYLGKGITAIGHRAIVTSFYNLDPDMLLTSSVSHISFNKSEETIKEPAGMTCCEGSNRAQKDRLGPMKPIITREAYVY